MKFVIETIKKQFTLSFDEDGILDTITDNKTGKLLTSTQPIAKKIITNIQNIISNNHKDFKVISKSPN